MFLYQHADRSQASSGFDLAMTEVPVHCRRDGDRPGPGDDGRHPLPAGHGRDLARRRECSSRPRDRSTAASRPGTCPSSSMQTSSTRAGTTSPALPLVHQLHDGLPDVLLPLDRGCARPGRPADRSGPRSGIRASTPHSHTAGGDPRPDIRSRYRQWLTHKLASWIDQFGVSGCVGCGRCITWCPVGIDMTEEVAAIRGGRRRCMEGQMPPLPLHHRRPALPVSGRRAFGRARSPGRGDVPGRVRGQGRQARYRVEPGQFNMLYLPGVGEVPISVSRRPRQGGDRPHDPLRGPGNPRASRTLRPGTVDRPARPLRQRLAAGPGARPRRRARRRRAGPGPARPGRQDPAGRTAQYGRLILLYGARQPADLLYSGRIRRLAAAGPRARGHRQPRGCRLARERGCGARPAPPVAASTRRGPSCSPAAPRS